MKTSTLSVFLLLLLPLAVCTSSSPAPASPKFYEILPKFFLPSGLFPDSVMNYTLSVETGHFELHLEAPCYLEQDFVMYYDQKITGTLKLGSITNLKGVMAQFLYYFWLTVYNIRIDLPPTDLIYFSIGFFSADLKLYKYFTIRHCKTTPPLALHLQLPGAGDYMGTRNSSNRWLSV